MKAIIDCNSFYCSCEILFRPDYKNKPVIVLSNNDGCIISRTESAKALGIKMAAPFFQVRSVVEQNNIGVFSSNYNLYGEISQRVMNTLKSFAGEGNVEVYSVDESFIELSHIPEQKMQKFCFELKSEVETCTGIPVSIGIAKTKVLCKVANRLAKNSKIGHAGVVALIDEQSIESALRQMKVEALWGIGLKFAAKLTEQGIINAWELRNMNEEWVRKNMGGVVGVRMLRELKGNSCHDIKIPLKEKQMITCSRMFGIPITSLELLKQAVSAYVAKGAEKLRRQFFCAGEIYVFVVRNDHGLTYEYKPLTFGLNKRLPVATADTNELVHHALPLLFKLYNKGSNYLKAGVIFSKLVPINCIQSNFFIPKGSAKNYRLMSTMDNINFSMRNEVVRFAGSGIERSWKMAQMYRSPRYTSRWNELREVI